MNLIDFLLVAVIALLVVLDILYLRHRKKSCGGCTSCPYAGSCAKAPAKPKRDKTK